MNNSEDMKINNLLLPHPPVKFTLFAIVTETLQ